MSSNHSSRPAGFPEPRVEELDLSNINNMPGVFAKRHDDFKASHLGLTVLCSVIQLTLLVHCFKDFEKVNARLAKDGMRVEVEYPILTDGLTDPQAIAERLQAKAKKKIESIATKYRSSLETAATLINAVKLKHELLEDRFISSLEAFNNEVRDLPYETKRIDFELPASIKNGVNNKFFNGDEKDPTFLEKDITAVKKDGMTFYMMNFFMVVKGSERIVKEKKVTKESIDLDDAMAGMDGM